MLKNLAWWDNYPLQSIAKSTEHTEKSRGIASHQITAHILWSFPNGMAWAIWFSYRNFRFSHENCKYPKSLDPVPLCLTLNKAIKSYFTLPRSKCGFFEKRSRHSKSERKNEAFWSTYCCFSSKHEKIKINGSKRKSQSLAFRMNSLRGWIKTWKILGLDQESTLDLCDDRTQSSIYWTKAHGCV